MVDRCHFFVERGRGAGEESQAVFAAQHAGEHAAVIGLALVEDGAAFGNADHAVLEDVSHPDRAFGVETDSVGQDVGALKYFGNIIRGWRWSKGGPRSALA